MKKSKKLIEARVSSHYEGLILPPRVHERKDGKLEIRISVGYTADGKQVRKSAYWTPPEDMTARQILVDLQSRVTEFEAKCKMYNIGSTPQKFSVVADDWFKKIALIKRRESTFELYKDDYYPHIKKSIGHIRIDEWARPRLYNWHELYKSQNYCIYYQ